MSGLPKGLLLAAIQIVLVLSLGGKLLYDRITRPRVWVLTAVYDPDLPIRGRYLSERLRFPTEGFTYKEATTQYFNSWSENQQWAHLVLRNGQLIATEQGSGPGEWVHVQKNADGTLVALSDDAILFFIPDNAQLPALKSGEEMWVEVTLPAEGPPRPVRIAIKKSGVLTPLKIN